MVKNYKEEEIVSKFLHPENNSGENAFHIEIPVTDSNQNLSKLNRMLEDMLGYKMYNLPDKKKVDSSSTNSKKVEKGEPVLDKLHQLIKVIDMRNR